MAKTMGIDRSGIEPLLANGLSYRRIAKKLKITFPSVQYWARKLGYVGLWGNVPAKHLVIRQKMADAHVKQIRASAYKLSEDLAYVLGVVKGDGYINCKLCLVRLKVKDRDFALYFKKVIERWSGLSATMHPEGPYHRVILFSKKVALLLNHFDLQKLASATPSVYLRFLEGFIDSEGWVGENRGIHIANTNYDLLKLCQHLLKMMKIERKVSLSREAKGSRMPLFKIYIRKSDAIKLRSHLKLHIQRKEARLCALN